MLIFLGRKALLVTGLLCSLYAPVLTAQGDKAAPVATIMAQEQDIQRTLNLTGSVTAAQAARLSVATSGLVTTIHVDAGSKVEAGDLLLELDPELAQLQLDSAKAQVEQAGTALKDARRRLEEAQRLIPQRSIAESVVRDIEAEVASDEADLHRAQADAGYREGILLRHRLRAPFAGVVSAKLTETGEWINPGQAVFDLVAIDNVRLDFPVSEDYLADIHPDAPVVFSLNSNPGQSYPGRVATVVPVTDPNARTFLLRVLAKNPGQHMLPGMSVRAVMKLATGRRGLVVPRDAIIRLSDGRVVVWVIDTSTDGPIAREQPVTTGLAFDSLVEIRAGLEAGTLVVTKGNEVLQSGQRVSLPGPQGSP
jgi:RND family efflux transporter MFP subunit